MIQNEMMKIKGIFCLNVFKKGVLIEEYIDHNLVVDIARVALARLVSGDSAASPITQIGFGTSNAAPAPEDTDLTGQLLKNVTSHSFPTTGEVQFVWSLGTTEGNGMAIAEFGLVCTDGSLFARKNRASAIAKESDITLSGTWTIQF